MYLENLCIILSYEIVGFFFGQTRDLATRYLKKCSEESPDDGDGMEKPRSAAVARLDILHDSLTW